MNNFESRRAKLLELKVLLVPQLQSKVTVDSMPINFISFTSSPYRFRHNLGAILRTLLNVKIESEFT